MILDDIVARRKEQLEREMKNISLSSMKQQAAATSRIPVDFNKALNQNSIGIISEVKKASPSKGLIARDFNPVPIAMQYEQSGANAISCLTEEFYFQGSSSYLKEIRKAVSLPILRKDFIIDPYQIYEARVIGADAILLIAAILTEDTLQELYELAHSLNLQCLVEVHNENELKKALRLNCEIIGINNRNLKTFQVDLATTADLARKVPENVTLISESGIKDHTDMAYVKQHGANAVLIGETLMRSPDIAKTIEELRCGL